MDIENEIKNEWWGYLHEDGTVKIKRYFSQAEIINALESPFVKYVSGVVYANNKKEATKLISKELLDG